MLERFEKWAEEIEGNWTGYSITYDKQSFIVYDTTKKELARIDYNDGRYDITGDDLPTVQKLTDLIHHRH
ncbi:hypothetical protein H8S90_11610 [Olivibacter sp. SDN3]|uniref:hypothetical protein n=1 Tax=Olivibacter sp. SDN3 TaxID=2764720 RepID=UPI001650FD1F|nr:hypothetical protein [Olivibacter sp. SDN3]QNL52162.1 hypothetical protein H8S90_11610 [Olivibacter sp. SDN3]